MIGEMCRLLVRSGKRDNDRRANDAPAHGSISSFQAFALSIASRVGTGNLAGVGTAIALGGPGAVFWMWVIAILGAASAFVESTLAQLFKVKGEKSFMGGPATTYSKVSTSAGGPSPLPCSSPSRSVSHSTPCSPTPLPTL